MRRLKGLDEMPRRRRTARQLYFFVRARILGSKHFAWLWPALEFIALALVVWAAARLFGIRLDQAFTKLLRRIVEPG